MLIQTPPHIFIGLKDDGTGTYPRAFTAMYASMCAMTRSPLIISIAHDHTVTPATLNALTRQIRTGDEIRCIDVSAMAFYPLCEKYAVQRYSSAVLWRVFLPEILPDENRVISCDADLIFLFDIAEIWNKILPEEYCIAATRRQKAHPNQSYYQAIATAPSDYFRMTISLIDLQNLKQNHRFMDERTGFITDKLPAINSLRALSEQSLFNYFFSKQCLDLDIHLVPGINQFDWSKKMILDIKGWNNETPLSLFFWLFLAIGTFRGTRLMQGSGK